MTQVSFYSLSAEDPDARLAFSCRLCEKARSQGHRVFILAESSEQARQLDQLLWQFTASAFLPHSLATESSATAKSEREAIEIGISEEQAMQADMLINLSDQPCQGHGRFQRIDEILCADEQILAAGRDAYRFYQAQGYKPQTHKL